MLLRGGRREALFAAELAPLEPFDVVGVVEAGSFEAEGEGVSSAMDKLSADISSKIMESLMMSDSVSSVCIVSWISRCQCW